MTEKTYNVGIYCRLSNDDERDGESVSIENQKLLLQSYVRQMGWNEIDVYIDDGYTGTNFNRPGVQRLIEDAKANAKANGIANCEFFAGDMKDVLNADFIAQHGHPDVVILDPPRAGIHPDVAEVILEAAPDRIVYVSCNPASQARDLALLGEKYRITAVQPVDMFPHTHHVENVAALVRKGI